MAGPAWGGPARPSRPGAEDCAFPPHPGEHSPAVAPVPDGPGRGGLREWVAGMPPERAPLREIAGVWLAGAGAWLGHLPVLWALWATGAVALAALAAGWLIAWRDRRQTAAYPSAAALLVAASGLWAGLACARFGPLGGWWGSVSWGWVLFRLAAWQLLARSPAARAGQARAEEVQAWTGRKAQWHAEVAPLLAMTGWFLVTVEKTLIGERWVAKAGPGNRASDVFGRRRKVIEDLTHYLGLDWGDVDLNLTGTPGELEFWIRTGDPWEEPVWHPLVRPDQVLALPGGGGGVGDLVPGWPATITEPVCVGLDPERAEPMLVTLWDEHGAKVIGVEAAKDGGKALALDTLLPTPAGWTTMGAVQVGDWLLGADGRPTRVVFATEVMDGHACYEVEFSDGSVIVADAEHLWVTEDRQAARSAYLARTKGYRQRFHPAVRTTAEIAGTLKFPCGRNGPTSNHAVANCRPLTLPAADLPIPPYVLGVWLGDGHSREATFSTADPEVLARVEADGISTSKMPGHVYDYRLKLPRLPGSGKRGGPRRPCGCCGKPCAGSGSGMCRTCWLAAGTFKGALRSLGVLGDKHIPRAYLRGSEAQRRDLLAGLLDSDGHCKPNGGVEFYATNRHLAQDVRELVTTLGYSSRLRSKRVRGRSEATSTCWTVAFTPPDKVFYLPRKAERQQAATGDMAMRRLITDVRPVPSVPVRCLQVASADHLYLAGRACIPTHNTTLLDSLVAGILCCDDAVLLQSNLSKALEDGWWEELAEASALGGGEQARSAAILEFCLGVIDLRPQSGRMTKVHRPSPGEPLFVVKFDELDKTLKTAEDKARFKIICSTLRSEGLAVVYAVQRGDRESVSSAAVQAHTDIVIWGKFTRSRELTHVAGREANLPDMGEYGGGAAGVFGIAALPYRGVVQKGRTFWWGEHQRAQRRVVAYLAERREPLLVLEPALAELQPLWDEICGREPLREEPSPAASIREKIAAGRARLSGETPETDIPAKRDKPGKPVGTDIQDEPGGLVVPGITDASAARTLLELAARPGGVTTRTAGEALKVSHQTAHRWIKALTAAGLTETRPDGTHATAAGERALTPPEPDPEPADETPAEPAVTPPESAAP